MTQPLHPAHVATERLLDLLEDRLNSDDAAQIRQHLEDCGGCRAEMALAQSFRDQPPVSMPAELEARVQRAVTGEPAVDSGSEAQPTRAPRRGLTGPWLRAGLATAAAVLLFFGVRDAFWSVEVPVDSGEVRGTGDTDAWLLDQVAWTSGGLVVAWSGLEGVDAYTVQVLSASGDVLWTLFTVEREVILPLEEIPSDVLDQPALFVRVSARLADGSERTSPPRALPTSR